MGLVSASEIFRIVCLASAASKVEEKKIHMKKAEFISHIGHTEHKFLLVIVVGAVIIMEM